MSRSEAANWVRLYPGRSALRVDVGIAVGLAFLMTLTSLLYQRSGLYDDPAEPWVWALGIGLCTLPLALRRRFPSTVAFVVAGGFFIVAHFQVPEILLANICLLLALYTVGAWGQNRVVAFWVRFGITLGMLVWLLVSMIIGSADPELLPSVSRSGIFSAFATYAVLQMITNLLYFGAAIFFGERAWRSARMAARHEAQGRELELERQTSAAQAVALDRLEIARELHDVVAHHVSVMGIQAAAARRRLDSDPRQSADSLDVVEQSAQAAVEELRRLVHTLRTPETEGAASSTVGVAQLSTLVTESRHAGTAAELVVIGEPRSLPMLVDVALYRLVQESLTNVRKHAGRGATAEVRLRFDDAAVEVEVTDDGVRQTLADHAHQPGLGLRGMRERIGAIGGTVRAERRERGGFIVHARVPLHDLAALA